ncbi:LytR C-terminal domain-containing protein [Agrococcus baldri]|uniref:LytR/CpsA/Psr regulator C-terminal domain-containing protein n=1 Tax=Agrococcus baldri TaxID=153730 RepID=A0AA87UYH6_9MICO|nr:LytR C-terminal domain-containing protein [Agrococcus baldri]GEK81287.1 hypothetical protein ABA31_26380 [Agrococcus baldri]
MSRDHRVGAHRSTSSSRWPRWAILLAALALAIVLAAVGLFALDMLRPRAPQPTATEQPETVTDPGAVDPALDASITVLDTADEHGFAAAVGQALSDAGWEVVATGGSSEAVESTVVWFDSEELAPVARGLAQQLGAGEAQLSDGRLSGTPITIVLGPDAQGTAPTAQPQEDGEVSHAPSPDAP